MNFLVEMKLNKHQAIKANFDGANLQECIHKAGVLLSFDNLCTNCSEKENFALNSRRSDGNIFTEITCATCGFRRRFGSYKDGSGYFLKEWEPPYSKSQEPTQRPPVRRATAPVDHAVNQEEAGMFE